MDKKPSRASQTAPAPPLSLPPEGRARVVIESVRPEIDGGQFPIKRSVGEVLAVEADIFADGHDAVSAVLRYRKQGDRDWTETPMRPTDNDRWRGTFEVSELGVYLYTVAGWVNRFKTWRHDLEKKARVGMDVSVELLAGARMVLEAAKRAGGADAQSLRTSGESLGRSAPDSMQARVELGTSADLAQLMDRHGERPWASVYERELRVWVEPVKARFSSWYELFPRSCAPDPGRHGTLRDCAAQLPRLAQMGFDVLYLPPIHPVGRAFRKGRNNHPQARAGEPGSPWGIGAAEGGHKAVHPELGTLEDFRHLVNEAERHGISVALDVAFQCSPDHPYVTSHPEWFRKRPDGSIQYAENPPKKYQDIYPIDFESEDWPALWVELKSIFEFWYEHGVSLFRVDNPHTKAFPFWAWVIAELKREHPEIIFLSEAFTRPKVMYRLAKLGFTQSYNYFPWRNTKQELTEYFTELARTGVREFFRPNLWPNTPDILTQYLQYGGRPAFVARLVLAATLGASYGIYGPAFELCAREAREIGSEEYLDSEKYEIKHWDLHAPGNLTDLIAIVNVIRRENPALHADDSLVFHATDNDQLIAYSKATEDRANLILTAVNLDPHHVQTGWVTLNLAALQIDPNATYQVHDLLTGARYLWTGARNYLELNPGYLPAHVFRVRRHIRSEHDFDYYS